MNSVRFNKDFGDQRNNDSLNLEIKLKRSFLNENEHGNSARQKIPKKIRELDKSKVTDYDKIKINESFYESLRIVSPNGAIKGLNFENKKYDQIIETSQNHIKNEEIKETDSENVEIPQNGEDFTNEIDKINKKCDYASLINDDQILKLLKEIFTNPAENKYQKSFNSFMVDKQIGVLLLIFKKLIKMDF